jgi:Cu/Ag efflux protein CusF
MDLKIRQSTRHIFLGLFFSLGAAPCFCAPATAVEQSAPAKIFHGVGVITGLDAVSGEVSIDHGEIPGLMSAMEMEYQARPPKILDGLKRGDKVDFDLDGATLTIHAIRNHGG